MGSEVSDQPQDAVWRIREAAIELFGQHGVKGTSIKAVANAAAVSPALVIHHFGSKDGLRGACDDHVSALIRERKLATIAQGASLDPLAAIADMANSRSLLRYLARTLGDGTQRVNQLVDHLVEDAEEYMTEAVETGILKDSQFPRERVVLLVLWSLGALMMHEHAKRLLGVDFLGRGQARDSEAAIEELGPYLRPAVELYSQGLLVPGALDGMNELLGDDAAAAGESTGKDETS